MLVIALVLALVGLVALVFAVVTSNELVAWVCIGASALGVVLLISDALRERRRPISGGAALDSAGNPPEDADAVEAAEDVAAVGTDPDAGPTAAASETATGHDNAGA
ncbi:MAG: hypothetical protein K2Q25_07710 [Mycobacteriaceae bacterium]|nr:hypothetical protein [Mycobacteriaceae bacterium]